MVSVVKGSRAEKLRWFSVFVGDFEKNFPVCSGSGGSSGGRGGRGC